MNKFENVLIGLKELRANKLRTLLTMLGIIFGVGAVIAMLSIGEGARQEMLEQIELMGTNNIIIREKPIFIKGTKFKSIFSPGLNLKDAMAIKELNPFVESVVPQRESINKLIYKSSMIEAKLIGTSPEYLTISNSQLSSGEFFNDNQVRYFSNVCVVGYGIKKKLFRFENPLGKQIKVEDLWFNIIGVVAHKNVSLSGMENLGLRNFNEDIYIPITTMIYKIKKYSSNSAFPTGAMNNNFSRTQNNIAQNYDRISVNQITIKIRKNASIAFSENLTSRILGRKHYGVPDFEVVVPEQLLEQKQKTQKIFNIVMGAIAGISLLVGGIGIMNIMLSNILERTKEIGIRRAMGATKKHVLYQFIYEAMTIGIVGGVLGILTGFILTSVITGYAEWRTIITPYSVALAFFISVSVGLVFGIYPAKKAADKNPIEALRYE